MRLVDGADFAAFFGTAEPKLRLALTAAFGLDHGRDAAAEALAWGWQNWDQVRVMENPVGYLYRVGRSRALRALGSAAEVASGDVEVQSASWELPDYEPNLAKFLASLPEQQRVAVWMVHGMGYTYREAAEILDCARPTIGTHVRRGLRRLRQELGVADG